MMRRSRPGVLAGELVGPAEPGERAGMGGVSGEGSAKIRLSGRKVVALQRGLTAGGRGVGRAAPEQREARAHQQRGAPHGSIP